MSTVALLEWADRQKDWVRDALRRHAARPGFILEEEDKAGILARVRHYSGFAAQVPPTCSPLAGEHLKTNSSDEPRAVLCSLGPVKHLNRLAEGQQLRFATNGVTIIYGDNGSGKSGYCRIAKKICRSLTADDLLGNVFEEGSKPSPEILVRFMEEGSAEPTLVNWTDGTPPPVPIARISVFDSANARLYVDKQNRIGFLPSAIALLESHGLHRGDLEAGFREEIKAIEKKLKTPLPGGYTIGGAVAKLLARLEIKAKDQTPSAGEITNSATLSEQEVADLANLEQALASDPSTMAGKRRRAKVALEKVLAVSEKIDVALSTAAIETYRELLSSAESAAQAASLAATGAFAAMPLTGVGLSPWRLLFYHACAYAESITGHEHDHLPDQEGDRCMLCQEPMNAATAERVRSFNSFMTGAANKAAQAASSAQSEALRQTRELAIETSTGIEAALGEFGDLSIARKAMLPLIAAYYDAASKRRDAVASATTLTDFAALPDLVAPIAATLRTEVDFLEAEAVLDDMAAANDGSRLADRVRRDELKDRKKLSDDLAVVLARLADLDERSKLLKCCDAVETGSVSRQMTVLRRGLVMEALERRVLAEIEALALTHIPFSVNDRSQDGQSYFEVGLKAPKATANSKVLSEGEQRALALACFLAEVGGDTSRQGMIIDDPVSSLDHVRIRKVAKRLVDEAATGRQIIIFTHNLLFFNEVVDAAAQANPQVPLVRNYVNKSESAGFGLISETDEPWIAQAVTKRIDTLKARLKSFDGITDFTTEAWRASAKDFYTDLRETWERLVEEVLLSKVVERFSSDVRTQSLRAVIVEDQDHKQVYWAMKRVSERSGHDMAVGRSIPLPSPTDMKTDLDLIDSYRSEASKRKKEAEKRRAVLESPPTANVR